MNSGWMRRTSRIYLGELNKSKMTTLKQFLNNYTTAINYSIVRIWSEQDFSNALLGKTFTDGIRKRFSMTARLSQCIAKQSKEMCNSQIERKKKRIPRMRNHVANLDSRFVVIKEFNGHFDMCLKFGSGVPTMIVPFNWTRHTRKFQDSGWELGGSIRLGYDDKGLFVDLLFEKEKPSKITTGTVIGIDRGFNSMLYTSDRQQIGTELKEKIKKFGRRRKTAHHYIKTEENRLLKELNLDGVKTIVLENLKRVRNNSRGKFSRETNRLLSFWHYAKVGNRLRLRCEEQGISIDYKDPWKTSQRCPGCGNIDRRNRRGERFVCLKCNLTDNADYVGAKNLEALGLAGAYSLRSLPSNFGGHK